MFPSANMNVATSSGFPTFLSNSSLLPLLLLSLARQKHTPDSSTLIKKEYDYVIVGGGAAGSVVAARLSEIPCVSVLLLEAGPPTPRLNDVPGFMTQFWSSDIDWKYKTAPQKHTGYGLVNRQVEWRSGKGLGGTTLLNAGVHVRGNKKDYDDWAAMGATGWSYREVLPYFIKLEDNRDPEYVRNGYHGVGGPVTVMRPHYKPEIRKPIFEAARSIGYKVIDPNGPRQTGFYDLQANQRDNQRCSTAKAYLVPAEYRKNLDILPNAFVRKVLIYHRRAVGVSFDFNGETYRVLAKREVILSAGSINTAQILMLSGIGPMEELQKFHIPVVANLPVGKNLHDHAGTIVNFALGPHIPEYSRKLSDSRNIQQYIDDRTGPLAAPILSVMAFLRDNEVNPQIDLPNHEIYFGEGTVTGLKEITNMKPEVFDKVYGPYQNQSIMNCYAHPLQPRSRGTVKLRSTNPYDPPVIDPHYLAHEADVDETVEGMKACMRIGTSPQMREIGTRALSTLFPSCEKYARDVELYFRCQARLVLISYGHPCGTAKMGDPRDPSTVVDPKLRVKGLQGLRVVDNSIMPKITSGNTAVPAIMIGEKASDIIKESIVCHYSHHLKTDYYSMMDFDTVMETPAVPKYYLGSDGTIGVLAESDWEYKNEEDYNIMSDLKSYLENPQHEIHEVLQYNSNSQSDYLNLSVTVNSNYGFHQHKVHVPLSQQKHIL